MDDFSKYNNAELTNIFNTVGKLLNKQEDDFSIETFLNKLPIPFAIADKFGNIVFINNKAHEWLGYSIEEISNMEIWWSSVYPDIDYRKKAQDAWNTAIEKTFLMDHAGQPHEWIITSKDQVEYVCEFSMVPNHDRAIIIIKDLTEERRKQEEIAQSKEFAEIKERNLRLIIENSPLPMVIAVDNQYVSYVNRKFTEVLGYVQEEIPTAEDWFTKAYPDEHYRNKVLTNWMGAIEQALKTKKDIEPQEYIVTTKSGEKKILEWFTVALDNQIVVVANDITENQQRQLELIEAKNKAEESDRLKSIFLANMSHEIRTPMNGILGFSELLRDTDLSDDNREHYINIIEKSGNRMLNTINDLIDISKIETGQMSLNINATNINKLLQSIYDFFIIQTKAKNIKLSLNEYDLHNELVFFTDKQKLYAILINLIKNAIKFTKHGEVKFGYDIKDNFIEFFVKDSGIGIEKEHQDKIFHRFVQVDYTESRKYEGSGLGLTISKAYVEMMGGEIWVQSDIGKGSVFYFNIPLKTEN